MIDAQIAIVERRSRRAKRVRITIERDGSVVLTRPFFISQERARAFLHSKHAWVEEKLSLLRSDPQSQLPQGNRQEYVIHKEAARALILDRLQYFQALYPAEWQGISIRHQKTRWGSCSALGRLSFSYRLLFLPEHLRDYVIVHELCHLLELNHSPRFWALVAQTFPDYQKLRTELRLW